MHLPSSGGTATSGSGGGEAEWDIYGSKDGGGGGGGGGSAGSAGVVDEDMLDGSTGGGGGGTGGTGLTSGGTGGNVTENSSPSPGGSGDLWWIERMVMEAQQEYPGELGEFGFVFLK